MKKYFLLGIVLALCGLLLLGGCKGTYFGEIFNADNEQDESEAVTKGAVELLSQDLDGSIVPDEFLTADAALSNAILNALYITVEEETDDSCTVTIRYPDAAAAFEQAILQMPAEPTQQDVDTLLYDLAEQVESGECTMLEGTYELAILQDTEGQPYLDWTAEALVAISGGLYTAE